MVDKLLLNANDVTLSSKSSSQLAGTRDVTRSFEISRINTGYEFVFDGAKCAVADLKMPLILKQVFSQSGLGLALDVSDEPESQIRQFNRILSRINSTPAYHLFLAGFHISNTVGLFDRTEIAGKDVAASFRYLVGPVRWPGKPKSGLLFFLPDEYVSEEDCKALMKNGKVFKAEFFELTNDNSTSIDEPKYFLPYAQPIGFQTEVPQSTKSAWERICNLTHERSDR